MIGSVETWTSRPLPSETPMFGRTCRVERLNAGTHSAELYAAFAGADPETSAYLSYGPFANRAAFEAWLEPTAATSDPLFHAIIEAATDKAAGVASLMRIDQANGVIEVGHIHFAPTLKQTPAATEALNLLMARVFDELGYRRLEWKCNAANERSRAAALRLGFTYEGTFRQAAVVKGRNRDTAWFSILDSEWPRLKRGYDAWLNANNFDNWGQQKHSLSHLIATQPPPDARTRRLPDR